MITDQERDGVCQRRIDVIPVGLVGRWMWPEMTLKVCGPAAGNLGTAPPEKSGAPVPVGVVVSRPGVTPKMMASRVPVRPTLER